MTVARVSPSIITVRYDAGLRLRDQIVRCGWSNCTHPLFEIRNGDIHHISSGRHHGEIHENLIRFISSTAPTPLTGGSDLVLN